MYLTANGSDSKKLRVEDGMDNPPSRVIHIRKLPNEVSETEVIALGLPFGKVTNILMLKGKNQVREQNIFIYLYFLIRFVFEKFERLICYKFLEDAYIYVKCDEVIK